MAGGVVAGSVTVMVAVATAVAPALSVTCRRTVLVPAVVHEVVAVAPVPSSNAPSLSRSQARETIVPSGSELVSVNVTEVPVVTLVALALMLADGGVFVPVDHPGQIVDGPRVVLSATPSR
jgi:hypothetical protein